MSALPASIEPALLSPARFDAEWWWVFAYGIAAVVVIVLNMLAVCAVIKNAFLHTNTNRSIRE